MNNYVNHQLRVNKRTLSIVMIFMLLFQSISMVIMPITSKASSVKLSNLKTLEGYKVHGKYKNIADYYPYDGSAIRSSKNGALGRNITWQEVNGIPVFCLQLGINAYTGTQYQIGKPTDMGSINSKLEQELSLISYYGYDLNPSKENYAFTQVLIWEKMGATITSVGNKSMNKKFNTWKTNVMKKVNNHYKKASFSNSTVKVQAGETVVVKDSAKVLEDFEIVNKAGFDVSISGNDLKITAKNKSNDGTIKFRKVSKEHTGSSIMYKHEYHQNVADFKVKDPINMQLKVEVEKKGELEILKKGNDTEKGLQGAEYDVLDGKKKITSVKTGKDGKVLVENLDAGKTYTVKETKAPHGYTVDSTPKTIKAKAGEKVQLSFTNEVVLGQIEVLKLNEEGNVVEGVTYEVKNSEGEVVQEIKTGKDGKATTKELPLGEYTIVEKDVPAPLIIDRTPIETELTYKDQHTQVVSSQVEQTNKSAKGLVELTKVDYKNYEGVDGATYGIYTLDDELVNEAVTKDGGKAIFDDLKLGAYYIQEIKAPEGYVLDTNKYDVTIEYEDMETAIVTSEMKVEQRRAPVIGTKASFAGLDKKEPNMTTITDIVKYENLLEGEEYTVTGKLMDQSTGEPLLIDGEEITGETTFVTHDIDGEIEVEFTFDQSKLKTEKVVVFEDLYHEETLLAVHHDIDDKEQTVNLPKIGTTASFKDLDEENPNITTLIDIVEYENLIPGKEYTVDGVLMDQESEKPIVIDDKEVTGSTTFTAEKANGKVEVEFTFDKSKLETKTVVVYEDLYDDNMLWAVHHDIEDENQTVNIPDVATTASFVELDEKVPHLATLVDVVEYTDLIVGEEYTVNGVLMDKETNKPILIDDKQVTGKTTFVAEEKDGEVEVEFVFDPTKLKTDTVVVFEDLYNGERLIAVHHDINDEKQTVEFPEIGTIASFEEIDPESPNIATLVDVVEYENLIPGEEYTVEGILMDQETSEPIEIEVDDTEKEDNANEEVAVASETVATSLTKNENVDDENKNNANNKETKYITGQTTFVPEESKGTVEVEFTFDKSKLKKETIVVFENVYKGEHLVAVHHDINDELQTVNIPEIGTTASFVGVDEKEPTKTTLVDVIEYKNLTPEKEYTASGYLMDKETGEPITINDEKIMGTTTFKAEKSNGTIEVEFTFDQSELELDTIVVFEDLYEGENLIAIHHDIEDIDQTVEIPNIVTEASFIERDSKEPNLVTIEDVVSYDNLIVGKEYTVDGKLMDKETGEPININDKEVTGTTTFTPEETSGSVIVEFTFDQSQLDAKSVVVFENLYDGEKLIAVHHDINDKSQTVDIVEVEVIKTASDSDKRLEGAEFTLYDLDGNVIDVQVTNKEGLAYFNLMDEEEAVIKETKAPKGYEINKEQSESKVKAQGEKITIEVENDRLPGSQLPDTATDTFNMALIGVILLIVAGGAFYFIRKRKAKKQSNE